MNLITLNPSKSVVLEPPKLFHVKEEPENYMYLVNVHLQGPPQKQRFEL